MSNSSQRGDRDEPGGHYVTSGTAVLGVGVVGLATALVAILAELPQGFIDRPTMIGLSLAFLGIGVWMRQIGRTDLSE